VHIDNTFRRMLKTYTKEEVARVISAKELDDAVKEEVGESIKAVFGLEALETT